MLNKFSFKTRARILVLFFLTLGGLLAWKLFFIQVVAHDFYDARADRQYSAYKSKESIAIRGDIYFQEKNDNLISAAAIRDGFFVFLNPDLIQDAEKTCQQINEIIEIAKEDCMDKANKKDDPYEVIVHRLISEQAQRISNLDIAGLNVFSEQWRFYPGNTTASQILGFVGYKKDELVGRYGLEQYYEDVLKGEKENLQEGGSFASIFFELGKEFLGGDVSGGHDIVLTIEPRVQSLLDGVMDKLVKDWSAESAGGIIMNPQTGAILAMAGKPGFDPNDYSEVGDISFFRNSLVSDILEVGSVLKPLTLAASMDAGKITPQTTYVDKGYEIFNGKRIENYDGKARGLVDMQEVLNQSLNTGAIFAMQELGKSGFLEYIKKYGLGEKTGIDLPDEVQGQISNLSSLRDIEFATASFGQGIAISPISFISAISSLANGGIMMKPYVVQKIIVDGSKDSVTIPEERRRVLKVETSAEITKMLVRVVDEALLGGTAKMDRYSVAAKTGTAQLPKRGEAGYYEDQYLHSFFGYAPAVDSKFLIFLYLKKPQGVRYASHTLTSPFMELMKFLLDYYEVPPDR